MSPRLTLLLCAICVVAISIAPPASAEVYELRTYITHEDKLDDLNTRFRDHTVALFKKHGMESVGYWVPTDEQASKNTLIYVLRHKSRDAAKASWKAFLDDPDWQKAFKESRTDGPLLAKPPESTFMELVDYTPEYNPEGAEGDAVFELRIYRCNEGKLTNLDARFRDHTIGLFDKHGIQSVAYWHPSDAPDSEDTLIYIVRHKNREAAAASWKAFASDDAWKKVAKESQKDGKFLRERPESTYMQATDYSAIK